MEFGILGPLAVWRDGENVPIRAAKQRALLAVLLLRRDELVPTERLIDDLWGERPPATATKTVQVYVSQLRKAIGERVLESGPGGYVLRVEAGALDLDRFEGLLDRGRRLLAGGSADEAAELLRRALAIWRGPALAEFRYEAFARDEIARLDELRLFALELRIEADVELGRHAEVVPELEALIREHPLRENLRRAQMLALYRSGRQADALAVMQDTRARLRDELGLDPGQPLQQLEKQILLQDLALDPSPAAVVPPTAPTDRPRPAVPAPMPAKAADNAEVEVPPTLEAPLSASLDQLDEPGPVTGERRRRRRWPLAAAVLALAAAAVAGVVIAGHVGNAAAAPVSLLRFDPSTERFVAAAHDRELGCACGIPESPNLWAVDGTLWEQTGSHGRTIAIRSVQTGRLLRVLPIPPGATGFTFGYGAIWLVRPAPTNFRLPASGTVERVDELSNRVVARVSIPSDLGNGTVATGNGAVWVLDQLGRLWRIDPGTNRITGHFDTGANETFVLVPAAGYEWISDKANHEVLRYDPATRRTKTFHLAQQPWHLVGVESPSSRSVWLLDVEGSTITRIDSKTGRPGQPFGLTGRPSQAVLTHGSIWIAEGGVVDRISVATGARKTFALPKGTFASGIAVDPVTGTVWVANSIEGCGLCSSGVGG